MSRTSPDGASPTTNARVIVLAGPSGSGKSRLADRLSQSILHLDDVYRDDGDPELPRHGTHVNWESPAAWHRDRAVDAILRLCAGETVDVPIYSMSVVRSLVAAGGTPMSNPRAMRHLCQAVSTPAVSR